MIRKRLETYHSKTEPLVDHYERQGILQHIDGTQSPDAVGEQVRGMLATLRREEEMEI